MFVYLATHCPLVGMNADTDCGTQNARNEDGIEKLARKGILYQSSQKERRPADTLILAQ